MGMASLLAHELKNSVVRALPRRCAIAGARASPADAELAHLIRDEADRIVR